jgi:hypothetical protein
MNAIIQGKKMLKQVRVTPFISFVFIAPAFNQMLCKYT